MWCERRNLGLFWRELTILCDSRAKCKRSKMAGKNEKPGVPSRARL
jgi:hypothetical protein